MLTSNRLLLTEREVAEIIGCSLSRLRKDRYFRRGLPYIRMSRTIRYEREAIIQYINDNRINHN